MALYKFCIIIVITMIIIVIIIIIIIIKFGQLIIRKIIKMLPPDVTS